MPQRKPPTSPFRYGPWQGRAELRRLARIAAQAAPPRVDDAEIEACLRVGMCRTHDPKEGCETCDRMNRAIAMVRELHASRGAPANDVADPRVA